MDTKMHSPTLSLFQVVRREAVRSDGWDKFLLLALVFNAPSIFGGFIPFFTQAATFITLMLYLGRLPRKQTEKTIQEGHVCGVPTIVFTTVFVAMLLQFSWVPYVTQFVTVALLGLLFYLSRRHFAKYNKA